MLLILSFYEFRSIDNYSGQSLKKFLQNRYLLRCNLNITRLWQSQTADGIEFHTAKPEFENRQAAVFVRELGVTNRFWPDEFAMGHTGKFFVQITWLFKFLLRLAYLNHFTHVKIKHHARFTTYFCIKLESISPVIFNIDYITDVFKLNYGISWYITKINF